MQQYNNAVSEIKAKLKELLTADNAEQITALDNSVDQLTVMHEATVKSNNDLKDTLVSYIKHTGFKHPGEPQDPVEMSEPEDIDTVIAKSLNKILEVN